MKTQIKRITPEVAKTLLEANINNRRFSKPYAKRLAAEMRAGIWHETHQGIAVDKNGYIVDGQHRLAAIVQSGVPQTMVVTSELEPDAYKYIDIGKRRNSADRLRDDPRVADVAAFIVRIADGTAAASRISRLEAVRDMVRDTAIYVKEIFPHKQRPFSSAVARTAFVVSVDALEADQDYAQEQFDALCRYDFDKMSDRSKNLVKRIAKGQFPAHSQDQRIQLCYAISSCLVYKKGGTLNLTQAMIDIFARKVKETYGESPAIRAKREMQQA